MTTINTLSRIDGVATPIAPYSLVTTATAPTSIAHLSGQCAVDAEGNVVGRGSIEEQTRAVFRNLGTVLASADLEWSDVAKLTCFIVGPEHIPGFNQARDELFAELFPEGRYPGNSLIVVAGLVWPDLLLEIEGVAIR